MLGTQMRLGLHAIDVMQPQFFIISRQDSPFLKCLADLVGDAIIV